MKRFDGYWIAFWVLFVLGGCARNEAWRTGIEPQPCGGSSEACATTVWERHANPEFELAFIEFTERGNVFSNVFSRSVYERLWRLAKEDAGLAVIVFVHGWKHNASPTDGNVKSFRKALGRLRKSEVLGQRKLVGIYIGWRGLSVHGLGTENLTYWERKAVAEEVGKGGVTEVFIELEHIDRANPRNYLFIVGHSFGGAITLSALNEIFLERLKAAQADPAEGLRGFGEGTVVINPAIEANQILQLKEASMNLGCAGPFQPCLLHVLSSQGDTATHVVFPLGQTLGVGLTWKQHDLHRNYKDRDYQLSEEQLDTTTVGNYAPFHTCALIDREKIDQAQPEKPSAQFDVDIEAGSEHLGDWSIHSYCTGDGRPPSGGADRLPCVDNEAVSFVYTSRSFIEDHNDVFNGKVMAYLSTLVSQAVFKERQGFFPQCSDGTEFFFERCFNYHWGQYKGL